MAKKNGNREIRKPKQIKEKVTAAATSVAGLGARISSGKKGR